MSFDTSLLKSPVGQIVFMAAANPVKNTDGTEAYSIRLAFDIEKDAEWLDKIADINHAKVVTAQSYRGKSAELKELLSTGKALVSANTTYKPTVFDAKGNEMEENPMFFPESTGTARMMVQPSKGERGNTVYLVGIQIMSLENPESTGVDRETRLDQLRELAAQG